MIGRDLGLAPVPDVHIDGAIANRSGKVHVASSDADFERIQSTRSTRGGRPTSVQLASVVASNRQGGSSYDIISAGSELVLQGPWIVSIATRVVVDTRKVSRGARPR